MILISALAQQNIKNGLFTKNVCDLSFSNVAICLIIVLKLQHVCGSYYFCEESFIIIIELLLVLYLG